MDYCYDGSYEGLLTVIFRAYKDRHSLGRVSSESRQLDFVTQELVVLTNEEEAHRVEQYLKKYSWRFLYELRAAFLSCAPNKDTAIVHTVFKALELGEGIFDSVDEHAFEMRRLARQVLGERHRYLGLIRFREMVDGTLFATIEPKNNVLPILISHFEERYPRERFAIYDKKRNVIAYYDGKRTEVLFPEKLEIQWSNEEEEFSELWKIFYRSIAIKERENKKLRQSHLPKYYWKHLVEQMEKLA